MNQAKINKQIFTRLEKLEKAIFYKKRNEKILGDRKSLPSHIIALRDKGFFAKPHVSEEVHKKLESIYPCDKNRVEVALLRLQITKKLRKASKVFKGKRITAYVW